MVDIVPFVSALSGLISLVNGLVEKGKTSQVNMVIRRFVAFTKDELQRDREEAEEVLRRRFPDGDE